MATLIHQLLESFRVNHANNAFCIENKFYTYQEFSNCIYNIQQLVIEHVPNSDKNVGLIANNDLETYAAIIALWLEGKTFVPLNPEVPAERNLNVIAQSNINVLIDSSEKKTLSLKKTIQTKKINKTQTEPLSFKRTVDDSLNAYILFTSGTTGEPKGVPITLSNLNCFIDSMWHLNYDITPSDRCLQMFELTFDFSVISYLAPLLKGACIYTVSKNNIKYLEVYKLIKDHQLTVLPLVPSILHYLRPHLKKIKAPWVRYSIFCGEALHLDVVSEWQNSVPNAEIINFYGPTEATVFCTYYTYKTNSKNKTHNAVLCIGKAMKNANTIIVDEQNKPLEKNINGELCVSGSQLTHGYWNNTKLNENTFFNLTQNGETTRFYKTGDLCFFDDEGDIMYLSRIDFQTKIQGYRVELSEIEYHAKKITAKKNVVAVTTKNKIGNTEILLAVENKNIDTKQMLNYLKAHLPNYMVPSKVIGIAAFPLNNNGKIDRNKIIEIFKK